MLSPSDEIELISVLHYDDCSGAVQRFASAMGELVLITDYPVDSEVTAQAMIDRHLNVRLPLQSDNMLDLRGMFLIQDDGKYFCRYVVVYPEGGFLGDLIFSSRTIGWYFKLMIARDIARGIYYLHENDIVHNDIRTAKLAFDCEWHCKLMELASITKVSDLFSQEAIIDNHGDKRYQAPEILLNNTCCGASDIFSFGVVLFELAAGVPIFSLTRDAERQDYDIEQLSALLPTDTPESLQCLIQQCLGAEAEYRPTIEDVVEWIESLLAETRITDADQAPQLPPLPYPMRRNPSGRHSSIASPGKLIAITDTASAAAAHQLIKSQPSFESTPEEEDTRGTLLEEDRVTAVDGKILMGGHENTIIAERSSKVSENDLKEYMQIKSHNLPYYKRAYFFIKDGQLSWCKTEDLVSVPERVHCFDLTHCVLDEAVTGNQLHIRQINGDVDTKASKKFFSTSKDRDNVYIKAPNTETAMKWRQVIHRELTYTRCQMCRCLVDLTAEQLAKRSRLGKSANLYCSVQCCKFKSAVTFNGMQVNVASHGGKLRIAAPRKAPVKESSEGGGFWRRPSLNAPSSSDNVSYQAIEELPDTVDQWLVACQLHQLSILFKEKGYDSILHIMIAGLDASDFAHLRIENPDHKRVLLEQSEQLRAAYQKICLCAQTLVD